MMINNNDRELKELGSPKDKLTLEREKVFTPGSKVETKRGCSGRCYHSPEAASEPEGGGGGGEEEDCVQLCLKQSHCSWADVLRSHPASSAGSQVTPHCPRNAKFALHRPGDDTLRTRLLLEIVFCRLNFPDCNADQSEV